MVAGEVLAGKNIFEPSAGSGHIVGYLKDESVANVIACEKDNELQKILQHKCKIIAGDVFTVTSDMISHVDFIIANPPFSNADKHILHLFSIAPAGCRIIALCNDSLLKNSYSKDRIAVKQLVDEFGYAEELGNAFAASERFTNVSVSLIKLTKPGENYSDEFSGFFMDEEPETAQADGIVKYDFIRDLVSRYIDAIKIFDLQLEAAVKMNNIAAGFFDCNLSMSVTQNGVLVKRNEFKKDIQKKCWNIIFQKLNMQKFATRSLKEDINKFVEKQSHIPFTMKNIYHMLAIVIGTHKARIERVMVEVFDKICSYAKENSGANEGWATNMPNFLNKRFIMPHICTNSQGSSVRLSSYNDEKIEAVEDFIKALCFLTGKNYDHCMTLRSRVGYRYFHKHKETGLLKRTEYGQEGYSTADKAYMYIDKHEKDIYEVVDLGECNYGQWFDFEFFKVKGYKKGTMHFEFKDLKIWERFNLEVARIKGYPLHEKSREPKQRKQPEAKPTAQKEKKTTTDNKKDYTVLHTFVV